jgi:outer membrane protein OmpA-like peptidoglycan-associated protein
MIKRTTAAAGAALLFATCVFAQAPPPKPAAGARRPAAAPGQRFRTDYVQTNQTKNDWEEINFEFNSAILSDGFPTLLWLADFLKAHPDYRVKIVGNTDYVGSNAYNNELAIARAESVASFLRKYGASAGQLSTSGEGKRVPAVSNGTKEGRFVNRRVTLTVTDASGRNLSLEDLIRGQVQPAAPAPAAGPNCCDEILKRLDDLAGLIRGLKDNEDAEHNKLRGEIADLRNQINNIPKPLTRQQTQEVANNAADTAVNKAEEDFKRNNRKFSLLGLNIGPAFEEGKPGNFSVTAKGQFFSPFGGDGTHAVQAQAEYMYYPGLQEGQFDIGLVNRWNRVQAGAFGSFKYIDFSKYEHGGGLAQASFVLDYLFSRGRVGIFGSKGIKNEAILNNQTIVPGAFLQTYARLVDQAGVSGLVGLWGDAWLEGNIGYLKSHAPSPDRPGFTFKLVQPVAHEFAVTAEVGLNETFVNSTNSGRVQFGFQWGNFIRPKDYLNTKNPVPMNIPRIRYNVLTRQIGAAPPVADAGPDQIGVRPGTITLNGTGSYDPLNLPLTYKWTQIGGPSVTISNATAATATFTAAEGQTYVFSLQVTNTSNLSARARTTVSTITIPNVNVNRFDANPPTITAGQCSILTWDVGNAETVNITPGVGSVRPAGTAQVCPTQTTTYTLTGTNATNGKQTTASVTVTVTAAPTTSAIIVRFSAVPMNINAGESSTLSWATQNAVTVTLNGQSVASNGSQVVSPTTTTTYTLTATGTDGRAVSAPVIVTVTAGTAPRVLQFGLNPATINIGGQSQLSWQVEGATTVSIAPGIGTVDATGSRTVNPTVTTTYVLTATNAQGSVTASATLTVGAVQILTFTNDPAFSTASGAPVTLSWTTSGASSVTITGFGVPSGGLPVNGSITVNPTTNTDYTLTAYGPGGQSVSSVLHVFVR